MMRRPPRSTLVPYTTLSRSDPARAIGAVTPAAAARELLDADAMARTLSRMAHELIERNPELDRLALVGIHTRGVPLAHRLRDRKSTRLNSSHANISYAVFCL